jgi:hypothetical protein
MTRPSPALTINKAATRAPPFSNRLRRILDDNGLSTAQEGAARRQATADDLRAAIDWAEKENTRDRSPLKGKIARDKVAVMGQSCGCTNGNWDVQAKRIKEQESLAGLKACTTSNRRTPERVRGTAYPDSLFYFAGPGAAGGASGLPGDPTNSRLPSGRMKFLPTALFVASFA